MNITINRDETKYEYYVLIPNKGEDIKYVGFMSRQECLENQRMNK